VLPDHHELGDPAGLAAGDRAEAVLALLDRAVALDRVDLQRARDQFALHLVADVFAGALHDDVAAEDQAVVVVIELDIGGDVPGEGVEVAAIVGAEQRAIEIGDRLGERRVGVGGGLDAQRRELEQGQAGRGQGEPNGAAKAHELVSVSARRHPARAFR
jgi:hypothetical protein